MTLFGFNISAGGIWLDLPFFRLGLQWTHTPYLLYNGSSFSGSWQQEHGTFSNVRRWTAACIHESSDMEIKKAAAVVAKGSSDGSGYGLLR